MRALRVEDDRFATEVTTVPAVAAATAAPVTVGYGTPTPSPVATSIPVLIGPSPTPSPTRVADQLSILRRNDVPDVQIVTELELANEFPIDDLLTESQRSFLNTGSKYASAPRCQSLQAIVTDVSGWDTEDIFLFSNRQEPSSSGGSFNTLIHAVYRDTGDNGYVLTNGAHYGSTSSAGEDGITWQWDPAAMDIALDGRGNPVFGIEIPFRFGGAAEYTYLILYLKQADGYDDVSVVVDGLASWTFHNFDDDPLPELTVMAEHGGRICPTHVSSSNYTYRGECSLDPIQVFDLGARRDGGIDREAGLTIRQIANARSLLSASISGNESDVDMLFSESPDLSVNSLVLLAGAEGAQSISDNRDELGLKVAHAASEMVSAQLLNGLIAAARRDFGSAAVHVLRAIAIERFASFTVASLSSGSAIGPAGGGGGPVYEVANERVDGDLLTEFEKTWNIVTVERAAEIVSEQEARLSR
jgi:hypothetical protein